MREEPTPEQIRSDIDRSREELGETVAAVADKADVKKHAQAKADELKAQAGDKAEQAKQFAEKKPVPVAIGAFFAGLVLGRISSS